MRFSKQSLQEGIHRGIGFAPSVGKNLNRKGLTAGNNYFQIRFEVATVETMKTKIGAPKYILVKCLNSSPRFIKQIVQDELKIPIVIHAIEKIDKSRFSTRKCAPDVKGVIESAKVLMTKTKICKDNLELFGKECYANKIKDNWD